MPRDAEKAYSQYSAERPDAYSPSRIHHTTIHYDEEYTKDEIEAEEHSVWILIYLSLLTPLLALLFSLYAILTTAILILLVPFCFFCTERKPLDVQLRYFLLPPISFQLGLIYSTIDTWPSKTDSSAFMLVIVNLFGPFYATWVAVSAWVVAGFWAFAAIMGDPDGLGGRDDGRAAMMGVRRWWERWLERALR